MFVKNRRGVPLNARKNGRHIVGGAPAILQDIETQLARAIDVGVKHLANEFHSGRFVGILFFEMHDQTECAIFKRRISRANDDGIPTRCPLAQAWTNHTGLKSRKSELLIRLIRGHPSGGGKQSRPATYPSIPSQPKTKGEAHSRVANQAPKFNLPSHDIVCYW